MKNNFIKQTTTYIAAIAVTLGAVSCSKLDEQVYGSKSVASASTGSSTADLNSVYGQLNQSLNYILILMEHLILNHII
jgi:hypothetical protein